MKKKMSASSTFSNINVENVLQHLEWDQNDPATMEDIETWAERSQITDFYKNKHVFITGATGFMGVVLVEKLLRTCPDVGAIYLLLRPKKGISIEERLKEMFTHCLFDRVRRRRGNNFYKKVIVVGGDVNLPDLGISKKDYELLTSNVDIIFHSAANVKFKEPLASLVQTNILGTQFAVQLAKNCKKLMLFVHVSTAYCHCVNKEIDEVYYKPAWEPEKLTEVFKNAKETDLTILTNKILGEYPNTYAFTKQIAEDLIRTSGLPACVFRPAIVMTTNEEPIVGWCQNLGGPQILCAGVMGGIIRTVLGDLDAEVQFVPVDMSINAMLACGHYVANTPTKTPIFNNVSKSNPITWGRFTEISLKKARKMPCLKALWYPEYYVVKNRCLSVFLSFLLHLLPALLLDTGLYLTGSEPKLLKIYQRFYRQRSMLDHFGLNTWTFKDENMQEILKNASKEDHLGYPMDIKKLSWESYFNRMVPGLRTYLLNDDLDTLAKAKRRMQKIFYLNYFVKYTAILIFLYVYFSAFIRNNRIVNLFL